MRAEEYRVRYHNKENQNCPVKKERVGRKPGTGRLLKKTFAFRMTCLDGAKCIL
jgi:hypothetical protein